MDDEGRNLGGRAYLGAKLRGLKISRRLAVDILNKVFEEMGLALRRGEYVEFPFGYLKAEKRVSRRWQAIGDEPMRPYFIDHFLDEAGERLLEGGKRPAWSPGWSLRPDKQSIAYLFDRAAKRDRKRSRPPVSAAAKRKTGK